MPNPSRPARLRSLRAAWHTHRWLRHSLQGAAALLLVVVAFLVYTYVTISLPAHGAQIEPTSIRDAKGGTIADIARGHQRVDVPLSRVAPVMQQAVVAAEDRHFYGHGGIDPTGLVRAALNDLRGRSIEGGSTITQQLVKNTFLTSQRTVVRKVKEAVLAIKLEQRMSKREILGRYLNTIYFGRGAYGIESAAQTYFGVHASDLQLPQAALLAGLVRAPEVADPTTVPKAALARRALVLDAMVRAKAISRADADAAARSPLGALTRDDPHRTLRGDAAYFTAVVEEWAVQQFGEARIAAGGLRIDTTLDPDLERAAGDAVGKVLDRPDDPDAALVSMADDGAVVALIGGRDFRRSQVNLATNAKRPQAGSTFKPFVLAAALDKGITAGATYEGPEKMTVTFPGLPPYPVENFGHESFGRIDLVDATAHSVNTVYEQLAVDVGLDRIVRTAHDVGIDSKVEPFAAMPLGTANVSPLEMVRAYMTFANRGERVDAYFVRKVTDRTGHVLFEAHPTKRRVYPEREADAVNAVLQQVIAKGTGAAAKLSRPAAGKTGTTSGNTDAWFVGYTPRIGTAVWLGYPADRTRSMNGVHGIEVTGGTLPAQIWQRFMSVAIKGRDPGRFVAPPSELMKVPPPDLPSSTTSSSSSTSSSTPASSTTTVPPSSTTTSTTTKETTSTSVPPRGG